MARDDYFVIVYKILAYLYESLKNGLKPDIYNILTAETYNIENSYFEYILKELQKEGYIDGVKIGQSLECEFIKITPTITIKPKGIEYLQENSIFSRVKKTIKDIKDTIPRIIDTNRCLFLYIKIFFIKGLTNDIKYSII